MARERTGSIIKRKPRKKGDNITWWARVTYTDPVTGKRHDRQRKAENKAHAKELMHALLAELDTTDGRTLANEQKTFNDLADYYAENYLRPAQYVDGRKVAGMRSLATVQVQLKTLRVYFGNRRLRSLTHGDVRTFRAERFKTPTRTGSQRAIASVNRELALLRRMLNVAQREGWIARNPFNVGDTLISLADERKRERIITRAEEALLLDACTGKRAHLRAIIICALDTGMRQGEILKLRWRDVDFENGIITVAAFNTKTMRERTLSLTFRLARELNRLYEQSPKNRDELVFGITNNVKNGFNSVRCAAGINNLRFHDLRHTAATRLVGLHIPLMEVGRVLGHSQANTTYRYVNANVETARRASSALDSFNTEGETEETNADLIN
jgi:integrase